MPPIRLSRPLTSLPLLTRSTSIPTHSFPTTRCLSTTPHRQSSHYDPPTGWLWGVPPGEKYKKEGWEAVWIYGFFGSFVAVGIAWAFKPDTSIQTWALEEARRRLEKEGILADPDDEVAAK
ncbi:MAG: hypothetical protein M1833_007134 [Piccolia ochrophora]|nr:MAG: hypothetical protein M1833_007134 [Piccolia ochrophora]